jgi:predicted RNA-binding protein with PUA-like domain
MNYWLMKSEPDTFSLDMLKDRPQQTEHWDGVRNYQARNMLRDQMKLGDQAFFYHSNCKTPGIVGIVEIVREGYPDFTAFDPNDPHYDPKSNPARPQWHMVDVRYVLSFRRVISLSELKGHAALHNMPLLQRGNRLSVMPVSAQDWDYILKLE